MQGVVRTLIHTFQAILLHAETTLHHRMAGETLVIMDILEIALHLMEETEIEGLEAGVRIVSVARGCKIGSASYIAAELNCDFRHQ